MDSASVIVGGGTIVQGRAWDPHSWAYTGVLRDFSVSSWHCVMSSVGVNAMVCLLCCGTVDIPFPSSGMIVCGH